MNIKERLIQRKSVIWALINREVATRFGKSYFGYIWVFFEPAMHIAMWVVLFKFIRERQVEGMSLYLFLLTGLVPYLFFSKSLKASVNKLKSIKGLLNYQPVKPIDSIIAQEIIDLVIMTILFVTGFLILIYINDPFVLYYPLRMIYTCCELALLTIGFSLILAIFGFYYVDLPAFITIVMRVLYFTSGAVIPITIVPESVRFYLEYNPLYQIFSIIRSSFFYGPIPQDLSNIYVIKFVIVSMFLGFSLYFVSRHKILMNAKAR